MIKEKKIKLQMIKDKKIKLQMIKDKNNRQIIDKVQA